MVFRFGCQDIPEVGLHFDAVIGKVQDTFTAVFSGEGVILDVSQCELHCTLYVHKLLFQVRTAIHFSISFHGYRPNNMGYMYVSTLWYNINTVHPGPIPRPLPAEPYSS